MIIIGCKNVDKFKEKQFFNYHHDGNINNLDPAFVRTQSEIWLCSQIYEGLVEYDKNLNIKPLLASSWEILESNTSYKFHLKKDVYFHQTEEKLTASHFVNSFKRVTNPKNETAGAWIFNGKIDLSYFDDSTKAFPIYAENDSTLIINLLSPSPSFLGLLTMPYCFALPNSQNSKINSKFEPNGTGPFKFFSKSENSDFKLVKNENYHQSINGEKLPFIDGVNIYKIEDKYQAFMKFMNNELDFINGISPDYKDEILTNNGELKADYSRKISFIKNSYLSTEYLGINIDPKFSKHPLSNKQIREAIHHAIDKRKLLIMIKNGIGTPSESGFVPNGIPNYNYKQIESVDYNPNLARKLVEKSGINFKILDSLELFLTSDHKLLGEFIKNELDKVGIPIVLKIVSSSDLRKMRKEQTINFFKGSWIADYPDAENYLACFYSKNFSPNGPNYFHYNNKEFDFMLDKSFKLNEETERNNLLASADNKALHDYFVIPLYYDQIIRLTHHNIENFETNSLNQLNLKQIKKTKNVR